MKAMVLTAILVAAVVAGCSSPPALREMAGVRDEAGWSGVTLAMEVPGRQFSAMDFIPVYMRVTNLNTTPVVFESPNNQKVTVSVFVPTPVGWKKLKDYYPATPGSMQTLTQTPAPTAALTQTPTAWTMAAGTSEVISVPLTVEPEWPTNSEVRLTAQVNGRPELQTTVEVFILPVKPTTPEH